MATINTLKLLKIIVSIGLFCVQVLGVWPYRYDLKSRSFRSTKLLCCYTTFAVPFILFAYIFTIKTIKINDDLRVHVPSSTGRFTTVFLNVMITVVYVITSVYQTMNYNRINKWFKDAKRVVEKIHCFRKGSERQLFLQPILHFIVNVLLVNGLLVYASVGILLNLISDKTNGKYLFIALYVLPNVFITIIRDIFYGLLLVTTYYYRFLNHELKNIIKEVPNNVSVNSKNYQYNEERSSHFCDEIDQLAFLHGELTTCTIRMNQIFSVPLMCFMACSMFVFVTKMFMVYITIEFGFRHALTIEFNYSILWYNAVVLSVAFWTLCVLSHSCHVTMVEVYDLPYEFTKKKKNIFPN